jgi:hypothetical protein
MNNFNQDEFDNEKLLLTFIKEKDDDLQISINGNKYLLSAIIFSAMVQDKLVAEIISDSVRAYNQYKISLN